MRSKQLSNLIEVVTRLAALQADANRKIIVPNANPNVAMLCIAVGDDGDLKVHETPILAWQIFPSEGDRAPEPILCDGTMEFLFDKLILWDRAIGRACLRLDGLSELNREDAIAKVVKWIRAEHKRKDPKASQEQGVAKTLNANSQES